MAPRTLFNATMPRLASPQATMSTSTEDYWKQVSNTLGKVSDDQQKLWRFASQSLTQLQLERGHEKGLEEGWKESPKYRSGFMIGDRAFNKAAADSHIKSIQSKANLAMTDIATANQFNPSGYQEGVDAYISGISKSLRENSNTAKFADLMESQLKVKAHSDGYKISKNYQQQQIEQTRADNEQMFAMNRENAFMVAGELFSQDPQVQANALKSYMMNKNMMDTALHAVLPDGTPVYTPMAVQKRQEAFHREFFTKASQAYIAEKGDLTVEDLKKLANGKLEITLPDGKNINILHEVGVDQYNKEIRTFAYNQVKQNLAKEQKEQDALNEFHEQARIAKGMELIGGLLTGEMQASNTEIMDSWKRGLITEKDARAAIKLASDPKAGLVDSERVADLRIKVIDGEDVEVEVRQLAKRGEITPETMADLLEDNAKAQRGILDTNKKYIRQLVVERDSLGIEDPKTRRHAIDLVEQYDHLVKVEEMSPELAFEKVRNNIDIIKDRANFRKYNSVPLYMEVGEDNEIDVRATYETTRNKFKEGKLTFEELSIELDRLEVIMTERGKRNE